MIVDRDAVIFTAAGMLLASIGDFKDTISETSNLRGFQNGARYESQLLRLCKTTFTPMSLIVHGRRIGSSMALPRI